MGLTISGNKMNNKDVYTWFFKSVLIKSLNVKSRDRKALNPYLSDLFLKD